MKRHDSRRISTIAALAGILLFAGVAPSQEGASSGGRGTTPPPVKKKQPGRSAPGEPGPGLSGGGGDKPDASEAKAQKHAAAKALRMTIENAEFDGMAFEDFIEWLGRTTRVNVVVRWELLEKEGVERDAPITLKRKNIVLRKLLPLVFAEATRDLRDVELAARAEGNILLISTRRDLNSKLVVVAYDVEDLLIHVPSFRGTKLEPAGINAGSVRRGAGSGGGQQLRPGEEVSDPNSRLDKRVRDLIDAITRSIEPDSWKANGGRGTITYYRGKLVILNNVEVHQALGGLPAETGR